MDKREGALKSPHVLSRKTTFPFEKRGFRKYWHGNSPFLSFFYAAFSSAFPAGETFFLKSVLYFKDHVSDKKLRKDMEQFAIQEAHHTQQHNKFNGVVETQGLNMKKAESRNADFLRWVKNRYSPIDQLSFTVAFEHFTAMIGNQLLKKSKFFEGADPGVVALWMWHSAEETEHKSVAYEVFQHCGGGYWSRIKTMPLACYKLFSILFINQWEMLREDKSLQFTDYIRGLTSIFGWNGLVSSLLPEFIRYFSPGFHPWEIDNQELYIKWLKNNSQYITTEYGRD